ncbi:MAG: phage holin family protein [Ruminococcus sp.]|nr:phage holin family protein [Ruminococcus sp.]
MRIGIINTVVVPFFNWFLGGYDTAIKILILLVAINCIAEIIISYSKYKKIIISIIPEKFLIFLVIGTANLIDIHLSSGMLLRSLTLLFYIMNESRSFLLNLSSFGVYIPGKVLKLLELFTNKDDNDKNSN